MPESGLEQGSPSLLGCYLVGSLDFNILGSRLFSIEPTSEKLFPDSKDAVGSGRFQSDTMHSRQALWVIKGDHSNTQKTTTRYIYQLILSLVRLWPELAVDMSPGFFGRTCQPPSWTPPEVPGA